MQSIVANGLTSPTFVYTPYQAMQSDATTSYSYDGLGRMSSAGGTNYQSDAFDRQRSVGSTAIHYDGFSQTPAIETTGSTDKVYALDPFGKPKAVQNGSATPEYLIDDGHGNIANVTGNTQAVTCSVQYDPWGNPISGQGTGNPCQSGSTTGDVFYRSARRDPNTGNYQFGYRTYDPTKAGFLSSDVYRAGSPGQNQGLQLDPLTADRYNYVNGDPVNLVDFNGHKTCAQGDPNPDCDAYRPGTQYNAQANGGKDQAYYDNQANQRAMADQQAAERYKAWQEQQKRDAAKHKNDCSWNPFDKNSCEARKVQDAGTFLDAHMNDINKWSGKIAMACGSVALFAGAIPVVGEVVGGCALVAGLVNVVSDAYLVNKAPANQRGALMLQTGLDAVSTIPGLAPLRGPGKVAAREAADALESAQGARTLSRVAQFFGNRGMARELNRTAVGEDIQATLAQGRADFFNGLATARDYFSFGVGLVGYEYGQLRDGS